MKLPVKAKQIGLILHGQTVDTTNGKWKDYTYTLNDDYAYAERQASILNARVDYRGIVVQALVHLEGITIVSDEDLRTLRSAYWAMTGDDEQFERLSNLHDTLCETLDRVIALLQQARHDADD
jgi:hypothetical protein